MLIFKGSANLLRIVVLNPKGGSGKTTFAFNLAGYLANTGRKVAVVDMDRQGSSTHWLNNRSSELPGIHGISVSASDYDVGKDQCIVVPEDIECAVVDAPAGLSGDRLVDYTCGAHAIFVPVLPSDLDIHAASRLISNLLLKAQVSRRNGRLGVVANRVKERTIAYRQLRRFLGRLSITVVGHIRDSQNYVHAAVNGLCIHEMRPSLVGKDLAQWEAITQWLERRLAMPIMPRDLLRPVEAGTPPRRKSPRPAVLIPAAAAVVMFAVSMGLWFAMRGPHDAIPVDNSVATSTDSAIPTEFIIEEVPEKSRAVSAGAELKQKWQLSGVARWEGSSVLILKDRFGHTTRRIIEDGDLDGWIIRDSGPDYAVLAQNGEEVRLVLNEDVGR